MSLKSRIVFSICVVALVSGQGSPNLRSRLRISPEDGSAKVRELFETTQRVEESRSLTSKPCALLWSAGGMGWPGMAANMGYGQAFGSLGLVTNMTSKLDAVSAGSGASWFMLQLFFSTQYFSKVIGSTPSELSAFVVEWMGQYAQIYPVTTESHPLCGFLENAADQFGLGDLIDGIDLLFDICHLAANFDFDWAKVVEAMIDQAASSYGGEAMSNIQATSSNKIPELSDVSLNIQTTLSPISKDNGNSIYYAGPNNDASSPVYTVPFSIQWSTRRSELDSWFPSESWPSLQLSETASPRNFDADDYYDESNNNVLDTVNQEITSQHEFATPFDGQAPTLAQIGSASSAIGALLTPGSPSSFAQIYAFVEQYIDDSGLNFFVRLFLLGALRDVSQRLWRTYPETNDLGVCANWRSTGYDGCSSPSLRFMDASFSDALSVAATIGSFQRYNSTIPLKIIVTTTISNSSAVDPSVTFVQNDWFRQYFSTEDNLGVSPGDFIRSGGSPIAVRSPQIFQEALSLADMEGAMEELTSDETVIASTFKATTVANSAFGVVAGQQATILFLQSVTDIPPLIVGRAHIAKYAPSLGLLAETIASNSKLSERVASFLDM